MADPPSPAAPTATRRIPLRLRARLLAWYALTGALLVGHLAWLWLLRGPRILDHDGILVGGQLLLGGLVLAMVGLLATTPADAITLPRRRSEGIIFGGAAFLQIAAVALLLPALSEDVVRYRVDGAMWLSGDSPYATTPAEWLARPGVGDAVDRLVPHAYTHSAYPPVGEALFAVIRFVEGRLLPAAPVTEPAVTNERSPWRRHLPALAIAHRGTVFRTAYAGFAIGCTALLLALLRAHDRSAWWAALFAWNPLIVLETGGIGHQDAAGTLFVLLALWFVARRCPALAGVMLALATGVKPVAGVIVPFLWRDVALRDGRRAGWAVPVAFGVMTIVLLAPVVAHDDARRGFLAAGARFSETWEANGSLYELFKWGFGGGDLGRNMERAKEMARLFGALALVLAAGLAWQARATAAEAGYWLLLVLLLVAPVAYPWYLVWVLTLVPLVRPGQGWTALTWSATTAVSYVAWHQPTWTVPPAFALAEYLPVYAVLVVELAWSRRKVPRPHAAAALTAPAGPGCGPAGRGTGAA